MQPTDEDKSLVEVSVEDQALVIEARQKDQSYVLQGINDLTDEFSASDIRGLTGCSRDPSPHPHPSPKPLLSFWTYHFPDIVMNGNGILPSHSMLLSLGQVPLAQQAN